MAAGYMLDMDDTEQRLSKYLIFYTQIDVDISDMEKTEILLMVNELNRTARVGHYFYGRVEDRGTDMVQYRATVAGPADLPFDEGVVADTVIEMGAGYDIARDAFAKANRDRQEAKEE